MKAMLKNYHHRRRLALLPCLFLSVLLVGAAPSAAQDRDTIRVGGGRVVLEFDRDGRLYVDGRTVGDGEEDGLYVFKLDRDGDGGAIVVYEGDEGPARFFARVPRPGRAFRFHESDPFDGALFDLDGPHGRLKQELDRLPFRGELAGPHGFFVDRLREDAEVAEEEHEARTLAREARRASGDARERIERDLEARLGAIFDRKLELRRERVDALERELGEAREQLRAREAAREDMIERRLRELLGEDDALDW